MLVFLMLVSLDHLHVSFQGAAKELPWTSVCRTLLVSAAYWRQRYLVMLFKVFGIIAMSLLSGGAQRRGGMGLSAGIEFPTHPLASIISERDSVDSSVPNREITACMKTE